MAIILYSSGITEEYQPVDHTFTDDEILGIFEDFENIETARLYEIPNTWCVWGSNSEIDDSEFNKLSSTMLQEDIFSPVMYIHDTEIDPAWMMTDNIIQKGYNEFKEEFAFLLDEIAENIIKETQNIRQQMGQTDNLVILTTVGPTDDKRVMFEFDPKAQSKQFYEHHFFEEFSKKVYTFLMNHYVNGDTFVLFADKKAIIIVIDENVNEIVNKIINDFKRREKYEKCSELKKILDSWNKYKKEKEKEKKDLEDKKRKERKNKNKNKE